MVRWTPEETQKKYQGVRAKKITLKPWYLKYDGPEVICPKLSINILEKCRLWKFWPGRVDEGLAVILKITSDLPMIHMIHFEFFLAPVRAKFLN